MIYDLLNGIALYQFQEVISMFRLQEEITWKIMRVSGKITLQYKKI